MRTLQEVGLEILNNEPAKFYVFAGEEYGIKCRYINILSRFYGDLKYADSVSGILKMMTTKHLIPLEPCVYVVRYDDSFISQLDSNTAKNIDNTNIVGTIVCIYQDSKHQDKLDKYVGDYTVVIDKINTKYITKYLHQDYPNLPDRLIEVASYIGTDYYHASNICKSMCYCDLNSIYNYSDADLVKFFGVDIYQDIDRFKIGFASRNFTLCNQFIDDCSDLSNLHYQMLSILVDIERCNKKSDSYVVDYLDRWTKSDVYNMFMHVYNQIKLLRSKYSDVKSSLLYLLSFLQFKVIPSLEEVR